MSAYYVPSSEQSLNFIKQWHCEENDIAIAIHSHIASWAMALGLLIV